MAKYIRCDCCGKPILLGEEVYKFPQYCGIYCSAECFTDTYGNAYELDEELADDCCHEIYDDEERKKELRNNIAKMQMELKNMKIELEALEECSI